MKQSIIMSLFFVLLGCKSTTVLKTSTPAKVYDKEGVYLGATPYRYTDRKISFSKTHFKFISDKGVQLDTFIVRKGRLKVGALFFIPYTTAWLLQYKKRYNFITNGDTLRNELP